MVESAYLAVALVGLLHGLEPGHGWPIATLYAARFSNSFFRGFLSSWIISIAHLISSIVIVIPFVLLKTYANLTLPYVNYIAGGALILMSLKLFLEKPQGELEDQHDHLHDSFEGRHEHEHIHPDGTRHTHRHKHSKRVFLTLSSIAVFALILGFAHEEEFVLLSLAVAGIDPLLLMTSYALAVMASLIGITLTAVRVYKGLEARFKRYEHFIPKISGLILLATGFAFILGLR
jgi:ABC-type nickel/cobalt efflux system permease component RcnA